MSRKNYGHIPHLPGSRMGPGDHSCHEEQGRIATEKARDKNDTDYTDLHKNKEKRDLLNKLGRGNSERI